MRSPLLRVANVLYHGIWFTSPLAWAEWRQKKPLPFWCMDLWIVLNLTAQGMALALTSPNSCLALSVALYGLVGATAALLRDAIDSPTIHRDDAGGYIRIRNRPRWLLLAFLGVLQIPTCFAILLLHWGAEFRPPICDPMTALYQSLLTFTTLGYGDILPATAWGKALISVELLFFLIFLGLRLPLAVSVMRVKEE